MSKKPEHKTQWTTTGFIEQFDYYMTITDNRIKAYYMTEEEHQALHGDFRYKSSKSFFNVRYNIIKK